MSIDYKRSIPPELIASRFSDANPIGTPCRYYSIKGEPEFIETAIRSKAWVLGHGAVVVKVDNITGGVSIGHLKFQTS